MHIWHTLLQLPKCTIKPHKVNAMNLKKKIDWNFDTSCKVTSVPDFKIHVMLRVKYSKSI